MRCGRKRKANGVYACLVVMRLSGGVNNVVNAPYGPARCDVSCLSGGVNNVMNTAGWEASRRSVRLCAHMLGLVQVAGLREWRRVR